ncbi:uncharacterized protein LOC105224661 isoform X2 [Bactrocera dorsalis]|uniref:Uncharacterized protein LOC105224661 isoform X2 n=1 Tax=Bactrocera dorsalis TaxID=27457 RepID=A0A8N4QEM5_BACDO|nr:uncharacterized protein LOC105224661 isoform X2 [Bactrocera dorsalis]XP_029405414.2 uncharacterized protein LOC105224661 isoform X2 [Bactrocera dorsalis]
MRHCLPMIIYRRYVATSLSLYEYICNTGTFTLVDEISQLEASCEKLRNSKKDSQALKEKYLRDIFAITHGKKEDEILPQQLSKRMQSELGLFQLGGRRVNELLERFHKDYKDWRFTLEQQMQKSLGADELFFLPQQQLMDKMNTLGILTRDVKNELNVVEKTTEDQNKVLEDKLRAMQEEVNKLEAIKAEMSAAQQRLIDALKEKQFKYQQDNNKLLREIAGLQEKLNLYE